MKRNCSKEIGTKLYHGDKDTDNVDEVLKKVVVFVNSGSGLTLEEIKNSPHLQNVISSVMSKNWRAPSVRIVV
ncbi:hypothetical protein, partial [Pectobacterium aquaticum]|uniref:hypothetical protein n=1 Tax=Pectobacterium aquaticum TaxID=2204145 RepID=UPI001D018B8E